MRVLLLLLALLPVDWRAGPGASPDAGALCSLIPLPTGRDAALTYILGTAAPDTVRAGAGSVRASGGPGHWSSGRARAIFGQVVQAERFGGADSTQIADAFAARGNREAVIVPWDYDPACQPTPWGRTARWSPVGRVGTYTVRPRPVEEWVEGRPTFDAFGADLEPYPHGLFFQGGYRGTDRLRTETSLTSEEFFELYRALPTFEEARRNRAVIEDAVSRWELLNPELRDRYPAPEIFEQIRRIAGFR